MPIREEFPLADTDYLGGQSDGWEYKTVFQGTNLAQTYDMVRTFLKEEGYGDLPLPATAEELLQFKTPNRNRQTLLFEDNGYVHNPIKILFTPYTRKNNKLTLCIYNDQAPQHLLKFHKKVK